MAYIRGLFIAGLAFLSALGCSYLLKVASPSVIIVIAIVSLSIGWLVVVHHPSYLVKRAIRGGRNIDEEIDEGGRTLLMAAAKAGNIQFVKALLKAGANVNARD